ncbi:unnamed protein product [Pedinophyceae sp. YPF-701]|nr:unnamed protein product [Pedinophyceae sp. YPF-701]
MQRGGGASRRQNYKKGLDAEEGRRKREDNIVALRRNKQQENLQKRRTFVADDDQGDMMSAAGGPLGGHREMQLATLPDLVQKIHSPNLDDQLEATQGFRKLLSIEKNPPIQEVIQQRVIPKFVEFLQRTDSWKLQFEAAWSLTNVASGTSDHTQVVIDAGAVPIFVQLLMSEQAEVREQAVWALGNIAGDSPKCRDLVLQHGALQPLLQQLSPESVISMQRNATWTLSNLCRGKPQPPFELVSGALPALALVLHFDDEEVLTDACWALSYLSDGDDSKIQAVIDSGVVQRLIQLLMHQQPSVLVPALRSVGNIVTGSDIQTQMVIDHGVLACLRNLLMSSTKKNIRKEACWTISNITAGTVPQIGAVIEANIVPVLVEMLSRETFDIKKEVAWAISNATSGGDASQIKYLVQSGCIPPLCDQLTCADSKVVTVVLEAIENILKVGEADKQLNGPEAENLFSRMVEECEGLDKIEQLQTHESQEVYKKAYSIIEQFYGEDGDGDDLAPEVHSGTNQYTFAPPTQPQGGFDF